MCCIRLRQADLSLVPRNLCKTARNVEQSFVVRFQQSTSNTTVTDTNERKEQKTIRLRRYCEFCSKIKHTIEHCRRRTANCKKEEPSQSTSSYLEDAAKPKCYGCGAIGVLISRCPKRNSARSADSFDVILNSCALLLNVKNQRPLLPIEIFGRAAPV